MLLSKKTIIKIHLLTHSNKLEHYVLITHGKSLVCKHWPLSRIKPIHHIGSTITNSWGVVERVEHWTLCIYFWLYHFLWVSIHKKIVVFFKFFSAQYNFHKTKFNYLRNFMVYINLETKFSVMIILCTSQLHLCCQLLLLSSKAANSCSREITCWKFGRALINKIAKIIAPGTRLINKVFKKKPRNFRYNNKRSCSNWCFKISRATVFLKI